MTLKQKLMFWTWPAIVRGQDEALESARKAQANMDAGLHDLRKELDAVRSLADGFQQTSRSANAACSEERQQREELANILKERTSELSGVKTELFNINDDLMHSNLALENLKSESDKSLQEVRYRSIIAQMAHLKVQEELGQLTSELESAKENRDELNKMLCETTRELERVKTELSHSTTDLLRSKLEYERSQTELEKANATIERAQVALEQEKASHDKTKGQLVRNCRWIWLSHRLDNPPTSGMRALFAGIQRLSIITLLLLPMMLFGALPPPVVGNVYSTNHPPWANTNVISLSTTNATSKPLTNHYEQGMLTLFGLEAGANITLTHNPSNIVITGSGGAGDAGGTNARQFGTLTLTNLSGTGAVTNVVSLSTTNATSKPITNHFENGILTVYGLEAGANVTLSQNPSNIVIASSGGSGALFNPDQFLPSATHTNIKSGAFQTNMNFWGDGTNHGNLYLDGPLVMPIGSNVTQFGNSSFPFRFIVVQDLGVVFHETGVSGQNGFIIFKAPPIIPVDYTLVLPTNQATSGQTFTNDGIGNLGWWDAPAIIAQKQFGSAVLTNLVGTVANNVTNVVSLSTTNATSKPLTNSYTAGVLTLFGLEAGANITLGQNASNITITGSAGGAGFAALEAMTNGIRVGLQTNLNFLTNANMAVFATNNVTDNRVDIQFDVQGNLANWAFLPTGAMANAVSTTFLTNWANAVSNYVTAATNSASVTNWINFRQPADAVLSNLVGTVANNVTNVISLSTTNATSKPLTNSYTGGVLTLFGLQAGANITLTPNGSNIVVASTASGGGGAFDITQFDGSSTVTNIRSGALLTNTLHYQSNITGPATIALSSIGGITNLSEWRQSNGTPVVTVNSNAQLSFVREDIKTAIAFRTNQIDLSTYQWKPFTNSLQTNIVLQITNIQAGVQTTLDIYGAGIMGGTVTNAWNVLFTVGAGNTIFWPVGATNGNFDVLVNSNQVVQVNLWASRRTNVLASYKAFE